MKKKEIPYTTHAYFKSDFFLFLTSPHKNQNEEEAMEKEEAAHNMAERCVSVRWHFSLSF